MAGRCKGPSIAQAVAPRNCTGNRTKPNTSDGVSKLANVPISFKTASRQVEPRLQARLFLAFGVVAFVGFLVLLFIARTSPYMSFDLPITLAVQSFHPPWFDLLMRGLSETGFYPQVFIWVGLIVIVLYLFGARWEAAGTLFAGAGIGAVGGIVKMFVARPRPSAELVNVFRDLSAYYDSFPAGHVMGNVAIMGFLIYLAIKVFKPLWFRAFIIVFFGPQILLIGLSRIYEGEHWFSDVLGAYLLGIVWLEVTIYVYQWAKVQFAKPHPQLSSS